MSIYENLVRGLFGGFPFEDIGLIGNSVLVKPTTGRYPRPMDVYVAIDKDTVPSDDGNSATESAEATGLIVDIALAGYDKSSFSISPCSNGVHVKVGSCEPAHTYATLFSGEIPAIKRDGFEYIIKIAPDWLSIINMDEAEAEYTNGVLSISLPFKSKDRIESETRRISIK